MLWPKHNICHEEGRYSVRKEGIGGIMNGFSICMKKSSVLTQEGLFTRIPFISEFSAVGNAPWLRRIKNSGSPSDCRCSKQSIKFTIRKTWPRTFSSAWMRLVSDGGCLLPLWGFPNCKMFSRDFLLFPPCCVYFNYSCNQLVLTKCF